MKKAPFNACIAVVVELGKKVSKLLPKIGNIVANDVPVSDDEDKDNKIVSTFGNNPTGPQYMHHHEVCWNSKQPQLNSTET